MIKILHLYHDLMNLYGDYGNLVVLCDNLKRNGIDYEMDKLSVGDDIDFDLYDFIYCGSGTESKTDIAFKDIMKRKVQFLKAYQNNKIILFTGSSSMLLGKTYDNNNGLGIFGFDVKKGVKRINGDVVISSKDFKDVIGFVNTSYTTNNIEEYISIIGSDSLLINNNSIGFVKNNLLAINMCGPLLVKNPDILKEYVIKLGKISSNNFVYKDTIKKNQYDAYHIGLNELKNRFNVKN